MPKDKTKRGGTPLSQQEFWILTSLLDATKHGYAIAKHVSELTEAKVNFSAATLYENLSRMLDAGLIEREGEKEVEPDKRRKVYRISGLGVRVLNEQWAIYNRAGQIIAKPAAENLIADLPMQGA